MSEPLQAVKISDNVFWVGAIDWKIREFHGYSTSRGTTYNAYLILDDTIILIDGVKQAFKEELLTRIRSVIDPSKIDIIVSNHSEMDHSGCLPEIIPEIRPKRVIASTMGVKALQQHFHWDFPVEAVKTGDMLHLGSRSIRFMETRMLHWPDSMFSYLEEDQILFSQDAFGMHLASVERFTDQIERWVIDYESAKYFANILMPFSPLIKKSLSLVREQIPDIRMIAHVHGPIWRKGIPEILDNYERWSDRVSVRKAVIVYDTMWKSTEKMAAAVCDGLMSKGVAVRVMPLSSSHRSDVATEILDAAALIVGSPTINSTLYPTLADVLSYLKGLKPKHLAGAAFGSYGWSGEAIKHIRESLESMNVTVVGDYKTQYVPDHEALTECFNLGKTIADSIEGDVP